jgi:hypothetical protein
MAFSRTWQTNPTPNPSLKGGVLNFTEFLDAKGVQKLQKKDFPALEGGGRGDGDF